LIYYIDLITSIYAGGGATKAVQQRATKEVVVGNNKKEDKLHRTIGSNDLQQCPR
jgi:hypothetical protein